MRCTCWKMHGLAGRQIPVVLERRDPAVKGLELGPPRRDKQLLEIRAEVFAHEITTLESGCRLVPVGGQRGQGIAVPVRVAADRLARLDLLRDSAMDPGKHQ